MIRLSAKLTEVRWHARGGQGAVTAAKMVAELAVARGKHFQAFPEYGPERSGAPIVAFTRHQRRAHPDLLAHRAPQRGARARRQTLLGTIDVTDGAPDDAIVIVNTREEPERESSRRPTSARRRVMTVPATEIAAGDDRQGHPQHAHGRARWPRPPACSRSTRSRTTCARASARSSREKVVDGNVEAVRRAYERGTGMKWDIKDIQSVGARSGTNSAPSIPEAGNARYYRTGGWRTDRPVRDDDKCTQCLFCYFFCPDSLRHRGGAEGDGLRLRALQGMRHLREECPVDCHRRCTPSPSFEGGS